MGFKKSFEIRKAKKIDLKQISEILRIESAKKPYVQKWTKKTALERVSELSKKQIIHVALVDDKIIGFITSLIKDKGVYVDEFWITKKFQRKGIGNKLINTVEEFYKDKGAKTIGLMANQKAGAVKFYKKMGYSPKHTFFYMSKKIRSKK